MPVPDGVGRPEDGAQVRDLLAYAAEAGASVIPFGGGTSVVGGVTPRVGDRPVLTVDLAGLAGLRDLDRRSGLATVGAGTAGPALETALAGRGFTLGHEPQSWELSTVGGWVATRSSGQRSLGFGRIEDLAGGTLEAPSGTLAMPTHPASAAGPDLRQLVLGSEGRLGILTEVVLRTVPAPEVDLIDAFALLSWDASIGAARELAQVRPGLSMVRASDPEETAATLALADRPGPIRALRTYATVRRLPARFGLLLVGATGAHRPANAARKEAHAIVGRHGGIALPVLGEAWRRNRFRTPYLRNALWDAGYAVDTLETATDWRALPDLADELLAAVRVGLGDRGERVHAFGHVSHVYPTGSSLYVTYLFRLAADPEETIGRWATLKAAASEAILAHGATISHHHGVGTDHAPYLAAEKGRLGMATPRPSSGPSTRPA